MIVIMQSHMLQHWENPMSSDIQMEPIISKGQMNSILDYIDIGKKGSH